MDSYTPQLPEGEARISLAEAAQVAQAHDPEGPKSASAVRAYCVHGVRVPGGRVFLEHVRTPRNIYTSREAMDRFYAEIAEGYKDGPRRYRKQRPPGGKPSPGRAAKHDLAEAIS